MINIQITNKIKTLILTALSAISLIATSAQAHLGWTMQQCADKWGIPQRAISADGSPEYIWFRPNGFTIEVYFINGYVNCINYSNFNRELIEGEADRLLAMNAPGNWLLFDDGRGKATIKTWNNDDTNCYAVFKRVSSGAFRLQISTQRYSDQLTQRIDNSL